jgi:hypothetical protein
MLRRKHWYRVSPGSVALAAAACAGAPPPRYPIHDAARILEVLRARDARLTSLRASGSADQFGRQGRVRGSVAVYVQRPDRLRVDAFAFGNLVSSVVSDGTTFAMLQGRQYVVGPARPCVAAQLMGIAMEGSEVVEVLSGGAPLIGRQVTPPRWESGRYVLDVLGEGGARERIELELPSDQRDAAPDRQVPRLARVRLFDARGERADITYSTYRVVNGVPFPERVRVVMPRDQLDTELRFDRVEPDFVVPPDPNDPTAPAPDPFHSQQPAGTERVEIHC